MKKIELVFFIILIIFSACQHQKDEHLPILNLDRTKENKIVLSDLAEDISYIPLSNDINIGMINRVEIVDSLIFVGATSTELLVFYDNGKLKNKIGRIGNGQGEYLHSSCFALDKKRRIVFVLDQGKIKEYCYDGKFLKNVSLEKYNSTFQDIRCQNGLIYLFESISFGHAKYNWLVLDRNGNEFFAKYNSATKSESKEPGNCLSFSDGQNLYYNDLHNDTIFLIKGKDYNPVYLMLKGVENGQQGFNNFNILDIVLAKNNLFIRYFLNNKFWLTMFNSSQNTLVSIGKKENLQYRDEGPGINNDFDSGCNFVPKWHAELNHSIYLCGYIYPYVLQAYIATEIFKNSAPKYQEKKKQLEKLANNLSESDNPVLILIKMKE